MRVFCAAQRAWPKPRSRLLAQTTVCFPEPAARAARVLTVRAASQVTNSPLHWASFKGHLPVVWDLLHHRVSHTEVSQQASAEAALQA